MNRHRIATLDLVRLIGMLLVMLRHSAVGTDGESTLAIFLLHNFISAGAVPVFFLLSGYLGARKLDSAALTFRDFAREKTRTYIVPYLFWNVLVLLLVLVAKMTPLAAHFRGGGTYFNVELTASSIVSALFGIGRNPIVFQFWFLRDLIVVSLVAWFLCRVGPRIPLLPWLFFFIPLPMASSLGYYLLGYQLHGWFPPEKYPTCRASLLYAGCWFLMGICVFVGSADIPVPLLPLGSAAFILMLAIVFSSAPLGRWLAVLGPATFFIYATHEPLQTTLAKSWQIANLPFYGSLFCFLVIPAIVFVVLVASYLALSRMCPRLMAIATGEREWHKEAGQRQ
ncbi:MAG TPA: acyltransferase [Candidatus Acidoferrales bacterium]|nr:acyltransferase [Candidatus Acidoferrales bacterium]